MLLVVFLTWLFAKLGWTPAISLWAWFSTHILITIILILLFA